MMFSRILGVLHGGEARELRAVLKRRLAVQQERHLENQSDSICLVSYGIFEDVTDLRQSSRISPNSEMNISAKNNLF